jgi:beta-phosphoglucomutase-like phosphatase (HAD superfamily)
MKYTTAFFDLDGVLWNSEVAHFKAFQAVAQEVRLKYPKLAESITETWQFGVQTSQVFENAFSRIKIQIPVSEIQELVGLKRRYAEEIFEDNAYSMLNQNSIIFAEKLKKFGYQLGLVSGSSKQNVDLFLRKSKTAPLFDIALNSSNFQENKPSPEPYLLAMRILEVSPNKCLAVEDSLSGLASARTAGIKEIIHYPEDMENQQRISYFFKETSYNHEHE